MLSTSKGPAACRFYTEPFPNKFFFFFVPHMRPRWWVIRRSEVDGGDEQERLALT